MELSTDQAFLDSYERLAEQRNFYVADYSCAVHAFRWVVDTMPKWFWWKIKDNLLTVNADLTVSTKHGLVKPGDWIVCYAGGTNRELGPMSDSAWREMIVEERTNALQFH